MKEFIFGKNLMKQYVDKISYLKLEKESLYGKVEECNKKFIKFHYLLHPGLEDLPLSKLDPHNIIKRLEERNASSKRLISLDSIDSIEEISG